MTDLSPAVDCDILIDNPPAVVWRALTEPELIGRWWAAADGLRPEVGHRFVLDMGEWGQQHCEVVAANPEKLLAYTFAEGILDTTITWRLEPEAGGTLLRLRHEGFDLGSTLGRTAREGMGLGWPHILQRIADIAGRAA